jgi:hypothetical protein
MLGQLKGTRRMSISGDRENTIMAMVTARSWRDPEYRQRLLDQPKTVLTEEGFEFPADAVVKILRETETTKYINLARDTADAKEALDVFQRAIPIPEGYEVRVVQSTERTRYFVLAVLPSGINPTVMTEAELTRLAEPASNNTYAFEYVVVATTAVVAAEVSAVAILS